uniref:Putative methyltransferase-like protein 15 n=1 Tax=Aceria tosichella TaxID=561515 RepID=A0A6G1SKU9_9ACAR
MNHTPVLAKEIVHLLRPQDGKVFIDMTFGAGGHSRRLLDTNKDIKIIAVDRDPIAYKRAQELSAEIANKSAVFKINQSVIPIHGKFSTVMKQIHLSGVPYGSVHGVIFDLGASSMQFDDPKRGFSISSEGPLDMRMDNSNESDITAEDVVNNLSQESLASVIRIYGEERRSRKLSNAIVDARTLLGRIRTTQELSRVVASTVPSSIDAMGRFAHGGTRLFQALRIFVNNELNELNYALQKIREFLIPAKTVKTVNGNDDDINLVGSDYGIAAVLTFHSLEDKIVKRHFLSADPDEPDFRYTTQHDRIRTNVLESVDDIRDLGKFKKWHPILKHVSKPSDEEIAANPRSRSAKLRAAIRID